METHEYLDDINKEVEKLEKETKEAIDRAKKKGSHPRLGKYHAVIVRGVAKDTEKRNFNVSINLDGAEGKLDTPIVLPIKIIKILTEHAVATKYKSVKTRGVVKTKLVPRKEKRYTVEFLANSIVPEE